MKILNIPFIVNKELRIFFIPLVLFLQPSSHALEINSDFINEELLRVQTDPDHTIEIAIQAPIEFVFEFLSKKLDKYVANAVAVEFDHSNSENPAEIGVGSIRKTTMENSEILVQRFLQFEPSSYYAYFTDMNMSTLDAPLDYSLARYELSSSSIDDTILRVSVVYKSTTRLLVFFVRRAFNSTLKKDFENAARIIASEYKQTKEN